MRQGGEWKNLPELWGVRKGMPSSFEPSGRFKEEKSASERLSLKGLQRLRRQSSSAGSNTGVPSDLREKSHGEGSSHQENVREERRTSSTAYGDHYRIHWGLRGRQC